MSYKARYVAREAINALALYAFLWQLKLQLFNYTIITYGYFYIRRWDKDHSTQNEMAIPIIHEF